MITKGNRREGQPVFVQGELTRKLERVPFFAKTFREDWIQQLIHNQPHILPVDEIEGNFAPLIPIGREISTPAGNIDGLFISTEGYLTIVETKLWRNPEARREVVGQILDYAKELNKWTFTELDNAVRKYNRQYNANAEGILDTIRRFEPIDESDETFLIDSISRNLKRGRFLLLIVGDGIRESVEDMVEYLSQSPQLYFTLALIELQVYRFEKDSFIVMPQIVTRTKEITRAIIKVEGGVSENVSIKVETDLGTETARTKGAPKRFTITEEDYFEQLLHNTDEQQVNFAKQIILDCEQRGYFIDWKQGSFVVKLIDPNGSGVKITLFIVDKYGMVYLGYAAQQLEKIGLPLDISYTYAADTAKLFMNLSVHHKYKNTWAKNQSLTNLRSVYEPFMERVGRFASGVAEGASLSDVP
jgi:hypothetical protein